MALFDDFEQDLENKIDSEISEVASLEAQNAEKEARWKQKRIGKITSSNLDKLMNLTKECMLSHTPAQAHGLTSGSGATQMTARKDELFFFLM